MITPRTHEVRTRVEGHGDHWYATLWVAPDEFAAVCSVAVGRGVPQYVTAFEGVLYFWPKRAPNVSIHWYRYSWVDHAERRRR